MDKKKKKTVSSSNGGGYSPIGGAMPPVHVHSAGCCAPPDIPAPPQLANQPSGALSLRRDPRARPIPNNCDVKHDCQLEDCELMFDQNVLILHKLRTLHSTSQFNEGLALLTLVYFGINVVCSVLNGLNNNDADCGDPRSLYIARCGSPTSDYAFHNIEFWATFVYALLQVLALTHSSKNLSTIASNTTLLKVGLFIEVVATFVPAMMVAIDLGTFEVLTHEIEYANELVITFIDLVMLHSLVRGARGDRGRVNNQSPRTQFAALAVGAIVAIVQLCVYNGMGWEDGDPNGETLAHYFEFTFEALSAGVTFWFCMDNKFVADRRIIKIMYGQDPTPAPMTPRAPDDDLPDQPERQLQQFAGGGPGADARV